MTVGDADGSAATGSQSSAATLARGCSVLAARHRPPAWRFTSFTCTRNGAPWRPATVAHGHPLSQRTARMHARTLRDVKGARERRRVAREAGGEGASAREKERASERARLTHREIGARHDDALPHDRPAAHAHVRTAIDLPTARAPPLRRRSCDSMTRAVLSASSRAPMRRVHAHSNESDGE